MLFPAVSDKVVTVAFISKYLNYAERSKKTYEQAFYVLASNNLVWAEDFDFFLLIIKLETVLSAYFDYSVVPTSFGLTVAKVNLLHTAHCPLQAYSLHAWLRVSLKRQLCNFLLFRWTWHQFLPVNPWTVTLTWIVLTVSGVDFASFVPSKALIGTTDFVSAFP